MTACQLASARLVPTQSQAPVPPTVTVSEYTQRKIYVSNVSADIDPQKLVTFFSKFGEIEEGPLGENSEREDAAEEDMVLNFQKRFADEYVGERRRD
ncbi:Ubp1-associated protein 2b [Thalictrum thalictroides]|uniref:Ubp1-associated protein 2b n=1 Tax=Thalictrum thalictroides TaxID=46969 RepID=A0A7J6X624_THATH|nr:Ubp1-associated protein 2b [Thalictrum thalictroides]